LTEPEGGVSVIRVSSGVVREVFGDCVVSRPPSTFSEVRSYADIGEIGDFFHTIEGSGGHFAIGIDINVKDFDDIFDEILVVDDSAFGEESVLFHGGLELRVCENHNFSNFVENFGLSFVVPNTEEFRFRIGFSLS
jgi:hypothetical protein